MELKRICKWMLISGTLVIWAIKFFIRPNYEGGQSLLFFLGIAPNLLGSFLIPFGAYLFFSGREYFLARIFRIQSVGDLRVVCLIGLVLLIFNEYLQLIPFFGRTFDYYDLVFSVAGLTASYFIFSGIYTRLIIRYYAD